MTTKEKLENAAANVMSVYSGKAGKCYCGCSGNHRHASAHVVAASKDRGYEVTADEVNDRQVRKVTGILLENIKKGEHVEDFGSGVSIEVGPRVYIVYFVPEVVNA